MALDENSTRHAAPRGVLTKAGLLLAVLGGVALGQTLFTFHYGEGLSYFSPDPKACVNCHIMQPQYDAWQKASHHTAARCIDCHLPHDFVPKYLAKAENGYLHSKGFTFQDFPEPIVMRARSQRVLQENCLRCHADFLHDTLAVSVAPGDLNCVHCHRSAGHGDSVGLGKFEPAPALGSE